MLTKITLQDLKELEECERTTGTLAERADTRQAEKQADNYAERALTIREAWERIQAQYS